MASAKESGQASIQTKKRKEPPNNNTSNVKPPVKKLKVDRYANANNARTIASQASIKAFSHGELDVDKFVKSREYEIRALEQGLVNSKKALSRRAFQLVPKELRRRTASHNVKRVPKRLRDRAKREMKEDNTPTVTARRRKLSSHQRLRTETAKKLRALGSARKARSSEPPGNNTQHIKHRPAKVKHARLMDVPVPKARFKKRQRDKSWLPTHLFHAKRARMTPPNEPLWRFALPLTPTAKSYRVTHRTANDRGALAFDMSYVSTIMVSGRYSSLVGVIQALDVENGLQQLRTPQRWKWLRGESTTDLHMYHRDPPHAFIAPVAILWRPSVEAFQADTLDGLETIKTSLFLRVHPSAFLELWQELVRVSKIVKPHVIVEDLRYEVGCIDVVGPASTEALLTTLKPCSQSDEASLLQLSGLNNTAVLPPGTVFEMEVQDPRICQKARTTKLPLQQSIPQTSSTWSVPACSRTGALFDRRKRQLVGTKLLSQKAINRRRSEAAPGCDPPVSERDPRIPIILYSSTQPRENKWTLLLPWKCVLPVWYALIYVPLSTGLQPRFGGLTECRDLSLEHGLPWFPADYPTSKAGWNWELKERKRLKADWMKRPKSKRVNWERLELNNGRKGELGSGWSCDWSRFVRSPTDQLLNDAAEIQDTKMCTATGDLEALKPDLHHMSSGLISFPAKLQNMPPASLLQVRIEHVSRGVSKQCARIYRLPKDAEARRQWIMLHPKHHKVTKNTSKRLPKLSQDTPSHLAQQRLAQSLLEPPQAGQAEWPACPGEEDLIGFVTSGNYDLGAGRGTAIGSILASAELEARTGTSTSDGDGMRLCVVRNSGQSTGRLAQWQPI